MRSCQRRYGRIPISVAVELEGDPILATAATMMIACKMLDGSTANAIIEKANAVCMAISSLGLEFPFRCERLRRVDLTCPRAVARPFRAAKSIMALHSLRSDQFVRDYLLAARARASADTPPHRSHRVAARLQSNEARHNPRHERGRKERRRQVQSRNSDEVRNDHAGDENIE